MGDEKLGPERSVRLLRAKADFMERIELKEPDVLSCPQCGMGYASALEHHVCHG